MTFGVELLGLTAEYLRAVEERSGAWDRYEGEPATREPEAIAEDYEKAILGLLASAEKLA